ncbi:DUF3951 domain-containing protein [Virgibacillus necropolis]|nr:DUF3951 domain-containing protein [Virgibacillus necropolis]
MELLPYSSAIFVFVMVTLICIVAYKIVIKKERPDNSYTPFDYIAGQTEDEFYEEQEEKEADDKEK